MNTQYENKPKILIVDDDLGMLKQLKWALEEEYEVLTASGREEALEIFKESHPELVALDVDLSGIDKGSREGLDILEKIKSNDNFDRCIVTSRFGILDILIYAEALLNVNRINRKERLQIISKCEDLIPFWPLPQYLINLTAGLNILYQRLTERDLKYKNGIIRDKVKINAIREEYLNNIEKEQFSNSAIEDIVINYKSVGRIITLDSSKLLPNKLFTIIREWSYLDLLFYEK